MAREEFTIRITKKGEVLIEVEGMPVRRIKDLVTYFEERVGPVRQLEGEGGGTTGGVRLDDEFGREEDEELEKQERANRLRREE